MLPKISISAAAVKRLRIGHPWVFNDSIKGDAPVGSPVLLTAPNGKHVGFGLRDQGEIAIRVLGRQPSSLPDLLYDRLRTSLLLRQHIDFSATNCFRLINGAGDGLPGIIVDRYADVLVLRVYGKCWLPHLSLLVDILSQINGVRSIFRKYGVRNVDAQQGGETIWGSKVPSTLTVKENDLLFLVRPKEGQKTGFFLDQREHRSIIGRLSKQKSVANLFCYNGGFSVYAAAGGAKRVYSIDIAAGAIEDAKENFRLNQLNPNDHVFESTDAFQWSPPESADLLICDPPSLSKGKRSDQKAWQSYHNLAARCASQVGKNGLLASASCTARLSQKEWEKAVQEGLRKQGHWSRCWSSNEPIDHPVSIAHPEGRYLKFALFQKRR